METAGDSLALRFECNGPGWYEYTLRGPQTGKDAGEEQVTGRRVIEQAGRQVVVEKATMPDLQENEVARYTLNATFHLKVLASTQFGPKETTQEEEVSVTRNFTIHRKNGVSHVVP